MKFDDETTDVLIGGYMSKDAAQRTTRRSWPAAATCTARSSSARTSKASCPWSRPTTWSARAPRAWARSGSRSGCSPRRCWPRPRSARRSAPGAGKLLHRRTASKLEEQAGATIPVGGAGLIVAYPHSAAAKVEPAVTRAIKKVVGEAEGHHVKALKGAIADAQQKMAESGT